MRMFKDGQTIYIEPWRSTAMPVIKDLIVDRSSFDRIQQSGGFVSVNTSGSTQDANALPIPKMNADKAFDAAACIGLEHVLLLVKTLLPCCLLLLKFHNLLICHKDK
jgi:succinate dehydrogenase / fumarate reductase iron-sulfur subunit